jgi:hypothetical protein
MIDVEMTKTAKLEGSGEKPVIACFKKPSCLSLRDRKNMKRKS